MKKTPAAALSALLLTLFVAPLLSRQNAPSEESLLEESLLEELSWMKGRWVIEDEGQYLEETWGPAREDAMVGSLRWARKGDVWLYELMSIEEDQDSGLVFRLRHFNRNLEPWPSEKDGPLTYPLYNIEDNRVVFENPERDSPRRFVYEREGDQLTVSLLGPDGVDKDPFVFKLDE
jgi:hypothetical protein